MATLTDDIARLVIGGFINRLASAVYGVGYALAAVVCACCVPVFLAGAALSIPITLLTWTSGNQQEESPTGHMLHASMAALSFTAQSLLSMSLHFANILGGYDTDQVDIYSRVK